MQQYDQRRLRLFAVVLFLGIMAANLGRGTCFRLVSIEDCPRSS